MARRQRFHLPEATYHVMLRGNNGQSIFLSEEDRSRICILMQQGIERFGHSILAFCLMSNHIHLAIRVANDSISRIIHHLAFRYTQYVNRRQNRVGHLFQGRFKSVLLDDEQYLKELVRYIHLNPVRAGIVSYPEEYAWSSHRFYMHLEEMTWLQHERLLKYFGYNINDAIDNYERFIFKGIGIEEKLNFKSGSRSGILGKDEFVDKFEEMVCRRQKPKIELSDLIEKVCKRLELTKEDLIKPGKFPKLSHARAILALLVREIEGLSIEKLGHVLKREASGLSKLAIRLEEKSLISDVIARDIKEMRNWIYEKAPTNVGMSGLTPLPMLGF